MQICGSAWLILQGGTIYNGLSIAPEVFALESVMYESMTVQELFPDDKPRDIQEAYEDGRFYVPCSDIIRKCWYGGYTSAEELKLELEEKLDDELSDSPQLSPWISFT